MKTQISKLFRQTNMGDENNHLKLNENINQSFIEANKPKIIQISHHSEAKEKPKLASKLFKKKTSGQKKEFDADFSDEESSSEPSDESSPESGGDARESSAQKESESVYESEGMQESGKNSLENSSEVESEDVSNENNYQSKEMSKISRKRGDDSM
jgi:hypothetical protein